MDGVSYRVSLHEVEERANGRTDTTYDHHETEGIVIKNGGRVYFYPLTD